MSLFRGGRGGVESRSISYSELWGAALPTESSDPLRLIPLYSAVTGIADDVSVMPWHCYRDSGAGWGEKLARQPKLLTDPAGNGMGFIPWMNQAVTSAALWGFAFAPILKWESGAPSVARWAHPSRVRIDETGATPRFLLDERPVAEYIYVPGPVLPGSVKGLSPTSLFRLQFGKSIKAQQYAAALFEAGVMPPGVLRNTQKVLPEGAAAVVKAKFKQSVAGRDIFVTGNDWEWTGLDVPTDDIRFLETIRAGATEIAAIYRVQPEDIGGESAGGSLTYSTLEMNQQNRNRRALLPWVRRFEAALTSVLPRPQYVKANMDALIRPDLMARMQAHEISLRTGMETLEEGRALEDKQPLSAEQISQWQELYRKPGTAPASTDITTTPGGK